MTRRIFLESANITIYKDSTVKDCWEFDTTLKTDQQVREELLPIICRLEEFDIKFGKITMSKDNKCGTIELLTKGFWDRS